MSDHALMVKFNLSVEVSRTAIGPKNSNDEQALSVENGVEVAHTDSQSVDNYQI